MLSLYDYISKYVYIKTKSSDTVTIKFNSVQERFYQKFRECYNAGKPFRAIVLKARQMGISTATESIMFALTVTHFNKNAIIVAHDNDATNNIYRMTKLMYDKLPLQLKPMLKYSNAKQLHFDNPTNDQDEKIKHPGLNSMISVATAGSGSIGRSTTMNYIHLSEFAFWKDNANDLLLGLVNAQPQTGQQMIVIESTANGYNFFKDLWDKATAGENDYIPFFFPWFEMQEYTMPYDGFELTNEEKELKQKYNLTNDQLTWRRWCIKNNCGGDIDKFRQEYPSYPEEAFLLTGNPVFNTEIIFKRIQEVPDPIKRGYFLNGEWIDDQKGPIKVWADPVAGKDYVIGGDTAGEGSDNFTAYIIDNTTGKQVASYCYATDEPMYVDNMYDLGKHYNWAFLSIEANFSTYPNLILQQRGYPNLFVREKYDTFGKNIVKSFGFSTNTKTRPVMISNLVKIVNESIELIMDVDLLKEMLSFIRNDVGRAEAAEGCHDDRVMACAICYMSREQAVPINVNYEEEDDREYNSFMGYGG